MECAFSINLYCAELEAVLLVRQDGYSAYADEKYDAAVTAS